MQKAAYLLVFLIFMLGCRPCEVTTIELANIPDTILAKVPYKNGESIIMEHSQGKNIEFIVNRKNTKQQTYCEHCCKYNYIYEIDETNLTPNYPIFSISFSISGLDTVNYNISSYLGNSSVNIPAYYNKTNNYYNTKLEDSILIKDKKYYQIFKIKSSVNDFYKDLLFVDSIYYNHKFGLLKIIMSNEETYTLLP